MQPDMQNSEATALDEQVQAEETISSKDEFALDIKYNGESMSLDREKAIEMAQKGMNYDHVFEELKKLRDNPDISKLEELSRRANMGTGELLDALLQQDKTSSERQNEPKEQHDHNKVGLVDELKEFFLKHPEIDSYRSIPEAVKKRVLDGEPIENAYLNYENRMLKNRILELVNSLKSPGALLDEGGGEENDAFASMLLAKL